MKKLLIACYVSVFVFEYLITKAISRQNVEITRYELCSEEQGVIKFYGHFTKEKRYQYLSFNVTIPFPLGDNVGIKCTILTSLNGGQYRKIHTIYDKNACKTANRYLGEHWYNISRAANMSPKKCPIPAGGYKAEHVLLNLNTLPIQNFPRGKLRFIMNLVNTTDPKMSFLCIVEDVQYVDL